MRLTGLNKFKIGNNGAGSGNALSSDILLGKTASTDAGDIAGTILNRSNDANGHTLASEFVVANMESGLSTYFKPPAGYYNGNTWVYQQTPNLIASNIRNGVNLFGVTGNVIEGKRSATGTVTSASTGTTYYMTSSSSTQRWLVSVTGIAFTPSLVYVYRTNGAVACCYWTGIPTDTSGYKEILEPGTSQGLRANGSEIVSGGFNLPVQGSGITYGWYAVE